MAKVSIDLQASPSSFRSAENVSALVLGCRKAYENLGPIRSMIEVFRITYSAELPYWPIIRIHFSDPLGRKATFTVDSWFVDCDPTADAIADYLCGDSRLLKRLQDHLKRANKKLSIAGKEIEFLKENPDFYSVKK
jgi:hypothetical protein